MPVMVEYLPIGRHLQLQGYILNNIYGCIQVVFLMGILRIQELRKQ